MLLGLGDDGHTASLFPGAAALRVTDRWATFSPPGTLPPPVDRVTLTFPVFNAARQVMFLVSGANKAEVFADVYRGEVRVEKRPAVGIRPASGQTVWLVDRAAAGSLNSRCTIPRVVPLKKEYHDVHGLRFRPYRSTVVRRRRLARSRWCNRRCW